LQINSSSEVGRAINLSGPCRLQADVEGSICPASEPPQLSWAGRPREGADFSVAGEGARGGLGFKDAGNSKGAPTHTPARSQACSGPILGHRPRRVGALTPAGAGTRRTPGKPQRPGSAKGSEGHQDPQPLLNKGSRVCCPRDISHDRAARQVQLGALGHRQPFLLGPSQPCVASPPPQLPVLSPNTVRCRCRLEFSSLTLSACKAREG
jgi:hypothetical protein